MDGYTYDEWLAMERLRSLGEYRGRKLDLGRKAAEERRRLIETRSVLDNRLSFIHSSRRFCDQRSILRVKPAAPSDIAGLCKKIAHPVSHFQTNLS